MIYTVLFYWEIYIFEIRMRISKCSLRGFLESFLLYKKFSKIEKEKGEGD